MNKQSTYIPVNQRKKILLLCDDIRVPSGIGSMAREFVIQTAHRYNWLNLGAGINHPEVGKLIDLSDEVNKYGELSDSWVKVIPNNGYGDPSLLRSLLLSDKPDAILIFTDPRYWIWLFELEREIRTKIPIMYLNIWDNYPAPMYNRPYYESVDLLMAISKQTKLINELVLEDKKNEKLIEYVPHSANPKYFFPISKQNKELKTFKENLFEGKKIDFLAFFNSRNIRRKSVTDLILAYRYFCDTIGKEQARKCALLLHTETVSEAGTDLVALRNALCDPDYVNVFFTPGRVSLQHINLFYNISDVTILTSANEGWGLSVTESLMAGTMVIGSVTGGIQDQMRFVDDKGDWYTPTANVPSNHLGTFKQCGDWAIPVFPSTRVLLGSPPTPYIFEDHCRAEDITNAIKTVYDMSSEERARRGQAGREWVLSDESGMSVEKMGNKVIECIDKCFDTFVPRSQYEILEVKDTPIKTVPHKLIDYSYE